MDLGIAGKRAAVAAASSGLGLASAKALAAEGVRVAICGREKARLDAAAAEGGEGEKGADDPASHRATLRPEECGGNLRRGRHRAIRS